MKFSGSNFAFPKWFEMSISDKLSLCFIVICDDLDSSLLGSEINVPTALGTSKWY